MIRRALLVAALALVFASSASAQLSSLGAQAAAAIAGRTYSAAEIIAMTEGTAVRAGTATLRGGFAFPVFVGGALITGALTWFYNQAQNAATGTSLDQWYRWNSAGVCYQGTAGVIPSADYQEVLWCRSDAMPSGTSQFSFFFIDDGVTVLLTSNSCGGNPWIGVSGIPLTGGNTRFARSSLNAAFAYFTANCLGAGTPQPSLADWIRGTYTPQVGQTAVPHPDAVGGINGILGTYIPTIPMPTPSGNSSKGITIGSPQPTQDVWDDGCNSGTDWNGTNCSAPDPLTQPCAVGYYRPFVGAVCEVNPNPEPACGAGLYRPYAGAACQAIQAECQTGYSRPNIGAACAPNPVSPAPIATVCDGMTGGDGVVGFVVAFFPNFIAVTKCMFVPTRDIPSRVTQLAAYGKTKFPFSVAAQLQSAFAPVVMAGDASVLPTNAGFFTLDWAWLTPLWALIKIAIGSFIHFSALWFIWGKLSPQVVV